MTHIIICCTPRHIELARKFLNDEPIEVKSSHILITNAKLEIFRDLVEFDKYPILKKLWL